MIRVFTLLLCLVNNNVIQIEPCRIGNVVRNECNKCLCTSKTQFECTPTDCNDGIAEDSSSNQSCIPNQQYTQNSISCICTKDGIWPHKNCYETFRSLDASKIERHKCDPDTYVQIDCNICRCGPDGEFISNRCTRNVCEKNVQRRSADKTEHLYGTCKASNWYSFALCQFCLCINGNLLICNTVKHNQQLKFGGKNMADCDRDMLSEALRLKYTEQRYGRLGELRREVNETINKKGMMIKIEDKPVDKDTDISNESKSRFESLTPQPITQTTGASGSDSNNEDRNANSKGVENRDSKSKQSFEGDFNLSLF